MGYSINTKEYHYIEWYGWNPKKGERGEFKTAELYDAINDPTETVNIVQGEKYKVAIETLSKQLNEGWRNAKPSL